MATAPQAHHEPSPDAPAIRIRGARVHNLKNLDLDLPHDRLVVITGPSGSGKSSLAFDTIYAEGQRQYFESLSPYARQFLDQLERPDVDLIEGLQPTIAIDQRIGRHGPRSTVATVTEIHDYLRLIMARLGEAACFQCGRPLRQQSASQIVDELLTLGEGTKAMILAPLVRGKKGGHGDIIGQIRRAGLVRARVDGVIHEIDAIPELNRLKSHTIEAVVDRVMVRAAQRDRLAESLELAVSHGEGTVIVSYVAAGEAGTWHDRLFSTRYACPDCRINYTELEPRTFSFNSPYGACPRCEGLGRLIQFDTELVIPDPSLSLAQGAVVPWRIAALARRNREQELSEFATAAKVELGMPIGEIPEELRHRLVFGDGQNFLGILDVLEIQYAAADEETREALDPYRGPVVCPECQGARLRAEARAVRFRGRTLAEICALTIAAAHDFFSELTFSARDAPIAEKTVREIVARLSFLKQVGLDYLTLDRAAETLSGGESQRVRLATGIGSGLVHVCYVLDEPSIGLHPRDNQRLITALRNLQGLGNTVIVVEHDEAIMRQADWIVDMGPMAGRHGGRIVALGTPHELMASEKSLTGRYLSGAATIPVPAVRRATTVKNSITLEGATVHNLKELTVRIPLGVMVCVTGVSGSGKSSLLNETFSRAVARRLGYVVPKPGQYTALRGVSLIDKLVRVDQSPLGRTPRGNTATYTGTFDEIRKVFAQTREARARGYKPNRFSFNVAGGRCEECQGQGLKRIEMNFLPDLYVPCAVCQGKRFNCGTLEIHYRERSIAEVLEFTVDDAREFFDSFPPIVRMLQSLIDVGLGYITLGQPLSTLSGGEAQRLRLAAELGRVDSGKTLYVLDEPTTGLHFDDVRRLIEVLSRLVDRGNSVVVIEHHLDMIKSADWIIDLGPEGGGKGGEIVATGTPEEVAAIAASHTGQALRAVLESGRAVR